MALKGQTKIQFFNAKTGELEQEVNETNMVTNAVTNALNLPMDFYIPTAFSTYVNAVTPIQSKGMAGVLVLNQSVVESADNISLPVDNSIIGHAGGVYSGTKELRGTYNTNESKALTNGYRHVWDFASDRANGDISCVCLTHIDGGNCGYNGSVDGLVQYGSIGTLQSSNSFDYYACAGLVAKGIYCYVKVSGQTISLRYYKGFDTDKVLLSRGANNNFVLMETVNITTSNTVFATNTATFYVDSNGILRVFYDYNNIAYCCEVDIVNKTLVSEKVIDTLNGLSEDMYNHSNFGIFSLMNDYCIMLVRMTSAHPQYDSTYPYRLVITDLSGNYIKDITSYKSSSKNEYSYIYDVYNKRLCISNTTWIDENQNIILRNGFVSDGNRGMERVSYCYTDIYPYYIATNNGYVYVYLDRLYLATINNLATTVTKTKEQTMKITYDITEV